MTHAACCRISESAAAVASALTLADINPIADFA